MSILRVPKNASLMDLERLAKKIHASSDLQLKLPNSLKSQGICGIEAGLIQLAGTWIRSASKPRNVLTYANSESAKDVADGLAVIANTMLGMSVMSLADEIRATDHTKIPRALVLSSAQDAMSVLRGHREETPKSEAFGLNYFGIPCIRRREYTEFDVPIYDGKNLVEATEIRDLVCDVIDKLLKFNSRREIFNKRINQDKLGLAIYELLENTHEYAMEDIHGNEYQENFRSLSIIHQEVSKKYIEDWQISSGKVGTSRDWMIEILSDNPHKETLPILEISIVDWGPGYASKALGKELKDISLEEEIAITERCFEDEWSSNKRTKPDKGTGLTHVLECVKQTKGYFRLRTGRCVVEREFWRDQSLRVSDKDIWAGSKERKLGDNVPNAPVQGTSFTMLLPIIPDD